MPVSDAPPRRAKLRLIGGFRLTGANGEAITIAGRRARGLLAYLAMTPERTATRERLCGLLWSDRGEPQARASLRQSLFALRETLAATHLDIVEIGRECVTLKPDTLVNDIDDLTRALADNDPAVLIAALETIGQERLLDDLDIGGLYRDWLDQARAALDRSIAQRVLDRIDWLLAACDWRRARALAEAFLGRDPLDETVVAAAIRADIAAGNTAAAHRRYQILRSTMIQEFGVSPGPAAREALASSPPTEAAAAPFDEPGETVTGVRPARLPPAVGTLRALADTNGQFTLSLQGVFRLMGPDGQRIDISSKKGVALVALLATAEDGERTRGWLQDQLWASREHAQAQGSLRRELSNLRKQLNIIDPPLLFCTHDHVRLDVNRMRIDVRASDGDSDGVLSRERVGLVLPEFLEGLDIAGEGGFEEWLREQRSAWREHQNSVRSTAPELSNGQRMRVDRATTTDVLPATIVDVSQPAPGFAGRPALAVMKFANLTGEVGLDYLAEGFSEDLIDRLARLRWLPVIARGSSFSLSTDDLDHAAVGRRLGARYLLEGRLRRSGEDFSLAVELSDAPSRHVLWRHHLEIPSTDFQTGQIQIVADLVGALDMRIDKAEQQLARAKPQSDQSVNDIIWRGRWHVNRFTHHDGEQARALFSQALAIEPESSEALIQATWALGRWIWAARGSPEHIRQMRDLSQRAIRSDPEDGRGHWLAGVAEMWLRRPSRAKDLLTRAILLNPSLAEAHAQLGEVYTWNGEPELALEPVKTSLRLSPNDLLVFTMLSVLATAHWMLGAWREAIDHAEQSIIRHPGYWYGHVIKINGLVAIGSFEEAGAALGELVVEKPNFRLEFVDWVPFVQPKWTSDLKQGLVMAAAHCREPTDLGAPLTGGARGTGGLLPGL